MHIPSFKLISQSMLKKSPENANGRTDGRTDRRTDGQTDGRTLPRHNTSRFSNGRIKTLLWPVRWRQMSVQTFQFICFLTVVRQCVQANVKRNVSITCPSWREYTGQRWFPLTKGQQCGKRFHVMTSSWLTQLVFERGARNPSTQRANGRTIQPNANCPDSAVIRLSSLLYTERATQSTTRYLYRYFLLCLQMIH